MRRGASWEGLRASWGASEPAINLSTGMLRFSIEPNVQRKQSIICPLIQKHICYYLCKKYIPSHFQHISSNTQPNLKNYGSFVNSFEFVSNLDQPGSCSFIRLEMAALQSLFVQIGVLKRMALKVWRQITSEYLNSLYESIPQIMAAII